MTGDAKTGALDNVTDTAYERLQALRAYRLAVLDARANGCSVQAIAQAAGVTRQNVYKLIRRAERGADPTEG
jgi:transposase